MITRDRETGPFFQIFIFPLLFPYIQSLVHLRLANLYSFQFEVYFKLLGLLGAFHPPVPQINFLKKLNKTFRTSFRSTQLAHIPSEVTPVAIVGIAGHLPSELMAVIIGIGGSL